MRKIPVSVVIIAKNEEHNLHSCLKSARNFHETVVLVDSSSTDNTLSIAQDMADKVDVSDFDGFGPLKNRAVKMATLDWVFVLDADERITPKLEEEIRTRLSKVSESLPAGFSVPRTNRFLGRWITHGGWYPDRTIRLFNKQRGQFNQAEVHESVQLDSKPDILHFPMLHNPYPRLDDYMIKFNRYSRLSAEKMFAQGKRAGVLDLSLRPLFHLFRTLILKRAYMDGAAGIAVSWLTCMSVFFKYLRLYEIQIKEKSGTP